MYDIAIVGGGPGGLYAAYRLAQAGLKAVVFEEHPVAGTPVHCTGVFATEAFDEFEIPRTSVLNSLRTARFFGPSGSSIEYTTPQVEALVIDRAQFDRTLCDMAVAAGAEVRVAVRIADLTVGCDRVSLQTAGGPIEARAAILACGANYTLHRRLGLGMPALHLQSVQLEVPASNPGNVELHFGTDVAPKGFAWVVPVYRNQRPFARIGLMCDRDARDHFDRFLAKIGPRWQTGTQGCFDGGIASRGKMLPLAPIERTYADRLLAVGDAAGLVKATTGGGIYYSLVSAGIAADVLAGAIAAGDLGADALAVYEDRWRSALGEELAAQRSLREIADRLSNEEIESLFELARTDGIMPIVRRTARFNRHRHLILSLLSHPPARRVLMRRVLGWGQTA